MIEPLLYPLITNLFTAISSDMYFERGNYDADESAAAQGRLREFNGQTAISSDAYFGRERNSFDEDDQANEGMLGSGDTYQQLEDTARDWAQRVAANPDVQQLGEGIRAGALKVSRYRSISYITNTNVNSAFRLPCILVN